MERFIQFVHKISRISGRIAIVMILAIFIITCLDIIATKLRIRIPDAVEIVGYLQSILIPAGAAVVFFKRQHIRVEIFTYKLPEEVIRIIDSIVSLVLFFLFSLIAWRYFNYGISKHLRGEYSSSLRFPFYFIIYLTAIAFIPLCLATLSEFFVNLLHLEAPKDDTD